MTCPLCRQRKAKRVCPGVGMQICAVCCGTKRLTEIACPPTCVYLETAQRHPAAVVKKQQELDLTVLVGALGHVSERQLQLFFVIHTFIARFKPAGATLTDADVAEAADAVAATLDTAARGVLYEHQATSLTGEALRRELRTFLTEVGRGGGSVFEREASVVLRGIARGARHETAGFDDDARGYLKVVARVLHEKLPDATGPSSPLIIP